MLPTPVILLDFCCVTHLYSINSTGLFRGTWMIRRQWINPDLVNANLFNPRHQCSIHMLNKELNAQVCDAIKV